MSPSSRSKAAGLAFAGLAALGLLNVGLRSLQNYWLGVGPESGPSRVWQFVPEAAQSLLLAVGLAWGVALAARGKDARGRDVGRQICVWLSCAAVPLLVVLLRTVPPVAQWHLRTGLAIVIIGTYVALPAAVCAVAVLTARAAQPPIERKEKRFGVATALGLAATVAVGVLITSADTVDTSSWIFQALTPYDIVPSPAVGVLVLWLIPLAGVVLPAALVDLGGVAVRRGHTGGRLVARIGGVLAAVGLTAAVTLTNAVVSNQTGWLPWPSVNAIAVGGLVAVAAAGGVTLTALISVTRSAATT